MIQKNNDEKKKGILSSFSLAEIIFISLMVGINVGFDILVSPGIIAITTHIVAGILIMLPVNFFFMGIVKYLIPKFGSLTLYMSLFGLISSPLTFWGGSAGIWKVGLGLVIGLLLDVIFLLKISTGLKMVLLALFGPIIWWICVFSVWQLIGLPAVRGMSSMLSSNTPVYNGWIDLSGIMELPIKTFGPTLIYFAIICGLISSTTTLIFVYLALKISKTIKSTVLYEKFSSDFSDQADED